MKLGRTWGCTITNGFTKLGLVIIFGGALVGVLAGVKVNRTELIYTEDSIILY